MSMPGLSGTEAFPLLTDALPDAKIIICSGFGINEACQSLRDLGAVEVVSKPFHTREQCVAEWMGAQHASPAVDGAGLVYNR